ncbi:MAG: HNH endonuclease [Defluviitaleaceae bacterium]|nr:HNH endonuclease [Defluviitaleaceae bacterium]
MSFGNNSLTDKGVKYIPKQRHCIICNKIKHESLFEKRGDHIIPETLSKRNFVTHRVCKDCNGGLGGTVDNALKRELKLAQVSFDRNVRKKQKDPFMSRNVTGANVGDFTLISKDRNPLDSIGMEMAIVKDESAFHENFGDFPILLGGIDDKGQDFYFKLDLTDFNPQSKIDIQGAVLKIAYEATHLYLESQNVALGDFWITHSIANEIRYALYAYTIHDLTTARACVKHASERLIKRYEHNNFYDWLGKSRDIFIETAIGNKCCVNGLWLTPLISKEKFTGFGLVFDIEGLPFGYVVLGYRKHGITKPMQIFPNIATS